jgi:hypothetical protein
MGVALHFMLYLGGRALGKFDSKLFHTVTAKIIIFLLLSTQSVSTQDWTIQNKVRLVHMPSTAKVNLLPQQQGIVTLTTHEEG